MRILESVATGTWPVAKLRILCARWEAGMKIGQIGAEMRETPNAIVGKAHRLIALGILKARPSPIKKPFVRKQKYRHEATNEQVKAMWLNGVPLVEMEASTGRSKGWLLNQVHSVLGLPERQRVRAGKDKGDRIMVSTIPDLPSEAQGEVVEAIPEVHAPVQRAPVPVVRVAPRPAAVPPPDAPRLVTSTTRRCQYILDDSTPMTKFCDEPTVLGFSWCEDHARRCYINFNALAARRRAAAMGI